MSVRAVVVFEWRNWREFGGLVKGDLSDQTATKGSLSRRPVILRWLTSCRARL